MAQTGIIKGGTTMRSTASKDSPFVGLLTVATAMLLFNGVPLSAQGQVRGDAPPGPAPSRPDDRPALTAPDRARSAEVSGSPELHFTGEGYAALFGGLTIGHELNDAKLTGPGAGTNLGDRNLLNSGIYGAKIGYFLPGRLDWLGVELEGFNSSPNIEQTGSSPGQSLRVTTLATNLIARTWLACGPRRDYDSARRTDTRRSDRDHSMDLPFCRLQPYAGVGLGAFFVHSKAGNTSFNDSSPGLNFLAGVRYYFTDNVAMFGEYKFNYASLHLSNPDVANGLRGDYTASHVVAGVSFHY
jgi:opacity protein-like surface antigen